jgi:surface antigen
MRRALVTGRPVPALVWLLTFVGVVVLIVAPPTGATAAPAIARPRSAAVNHVRFGGTTSPSAVAAPAIADPNDWRVDSINYQHGHRPDPPVPSLPDCRAKAAQQPGGAVDWLRSRIGACWVATVSHIDTTACPQPTAPCLPNSFDLRITMIAVGATRDRTVLIGVYVEVVDSDGPTVGLINVKFDVSCVVNGIGECHTSMGLDATIADLRTRPPDRPITSILVTSADAQADPTDPMRRTFATLSAVATIDGVVADGPRDLGDEIRFDSGTDRLQAWNPAGAIFPLAVPILMLNMADPEIPESATHVFDATTRPGLTVPAYAGKTVPGAWGSGEPLHRAAAQAVQDANRSAACPSNYRTRWNPPDYSYVSGSCDEYPYASTYEGAAATYGSPAQRFSVRTLDGPDNIEEGRRLAGFGVAQRLLDGDPFYVLPFGTPFPAPVGGGITVADVAGGGAFRTVWLANGGAGGVLGQPTGNWYAITGGQRQDFYNGSIYWSIATGTHELDGLAAVDYRAMNGPGSVLGFPTADMTPGPDGGRTSAFTPTSCTVSGITGSGSALLANATGSGEMQGCLYQAYLKTYQGPAGTLGYPSSDERPIGRGRVNYLQGTACGEATGSALYWNGAVHAVIGCIFQKYAEIGEAGSILGFPIDDEHPVTGGVAQDFQYGQITDIGGTVSVGSTRTGWVVGHARHAGNDYPYETFGQFGHQNEGTDAWNEYYGQCDSFAAWKAYENLADTGTQHPSAVPAPGWRPSNAGISPVNQFTWGVHGGNGNADIWATRWRQAGYTVDNVPAPGAIVNWPNAVADSQDGSPADPANGIGGFGHVGYVTDVYPDGSITVEQYNMQSNGEYSVVHMAYGKGYTDNSFGQPGFTVPWPKYFIHVNDGPAANVASPPEPATGVVFASYSQQVKVIGPGSAQFSTTTTAWNPDAGHGELGTMLSTRTNGTQTPSSTATWRPIGLNATACYQVDAFVPNNYSNNPIARYTVADARQTVVATVDENAHTNDWAMLGVFQPRSDGTLSVTLDNRGTAGQYVAADAMRFWPAACASYGTSLLVGPGAGAFSTSAGWTVESGHGYDGAMRWIATNGNATSLTPAHTATWAPTNLVPSACYEIQAFVPDDHSNHHAARYHVQDQHFSTFWPQVDENLLTNQVASLGVFQAWANGTLPVILTDDGPAGRFVAADLLAYTITSCTRLGSPYGSGHTAIVRIGPGSDPAAFTTTDYWYPGIGHGVAGHDLWTYTNGATAVSTATWTAQLSPGTCYQVAAWVPANYYANNTSARYVVTIWNGTAAAGGPLGTVNQAVIGDAWAPLGQITTADGRIQVTLDDTGPPGTFTAADALEFIPC